MENFDEIVNINTFINRLIYYLKLGIYINKGSTDEIMLEKCLKLCNRIVDIQSTLNSTTNDTQTNNAHIYIRKLLKRFNLVLKVDSLNLPVDILNKTNQLNIFNLIEHASLIENDVDKMIEYATVHNLHIFTNIPLTFFLTNDTNKMAHQHRNLIWQYTRSLFYISNILLLKFCNNKKIRNNLTNISLEKLTFSLQIIDDIEQETQINNLIQADSFMSTKIIKTGLNAKSVNDAHKSIMESFAQNGVEVNNSMVKMIESVTSKLQTTSLQEGNILQNIINLAKNVADEIKDDVSQNPEEFSQNISSIFNVFKNNVNNEEIANEIGPEFSGIVSLIGKISNEATPNTLHDDKELYDTLDKYLESNNLNKNDFFKNILNENNQIDREKLEIVLSNTK